MPVVGGGTSTPWLLLLVDYRPLYRGVAMAMQQGQRREEQQENTRICRRQFSLLLRQGIHAYVLW